MGSLVRHWEGLEWQSYCLSLLQRRYAETNPHSLQTVPDQHAGDWGIEAYSDDGCVYQCYAAQNALDSKSLYEHQRDKLTRDLGKLKTYSGDLSRVFGALKIHRYVFMVHTFTDKALLIHATSKAAEVSKWQLPFIDTNFSIRVQTDADYPTERQAINSLPEPLILGAATTDLDRDAWMSENNSLVDGAKGKLLKIHASEGTVTKILKSLTVQYLDSENSLDRLADIAPQAHAGLLQTKHRQENWMELEFPVGQPRQHGSIVELAKKFSLMIQNEIRITTPAQADVLAWGAVADWLMRCPLDFEDASGSS